jgi:hypothetical protein
VHTERFNDGKCDTKVRLWVGTVFETKHKTYLFIFKGNTGFSRFSDLGIAVNSIRDLYFVFNMIDSIETFTKRLSFVKTSVLFLALMVDNTVQPALGNSFIKNENL